jgi:hypothetical protein
MGLGPFIVIIKELKAHVFNAKEREKYRMGIGGFSHRTYYVTFRYTSCEVE